HGDAGTGRHQPRRGAHRGARSRTGPRWEEARMTTIEDLINPSLISVSLSATDRRGAIEELAKLLEADRRVTDVPTYVDAVWAREQETGGTGMESGIAIPHAKSPAVVRPSVAFGRSEAGVDFGAEDGSTADLIFLIAAP